MTSANTVQSEIGYLHGISFADDRIHKRQLLEPDICDIRCSSYFERKRGGFAEERIAWDICALLESFAPAKTDSNYRMIWFRIPRGTVDDWMTIDEYRDYAEMYEEPEEEIDKARQTEWAECFPNTEYWHTLSSNSEDEWAAIAVDHRMVIEVRPNETTPYENPRLRLLLEKLRSTAASFVELATRGESQELVAQTLPPDCRFGFVPRHIWWERFGKEECFNDGKIDRDEAEELAKLLANQPDRRDVGRLPALSAGQYFNALKGAYEAAGYEYDGKHNWRGLPDGDDRAWYARFGDARDESILELDQESPEAFEAWFHDKGHFFNHTFEVLAGSSIARAHLHPCHDSLGWYCTLGGSLTWRAIDMARMWRYLNDNGFPTFLHDATDIAAMLVGEDDLLIVPFNEEIWHRGTEHFGRHAVTCVHFPETDADTILEDVEWVKETPPYLIEFSIELNSAQVSALIEALDIYSRIWMGQYDELEWQMRFTASDFDAIGAEKPLREQLWLEMRSLVLPELRGMGLNGSHGIWSPSVPDRAQASYDMKQVLRHAWAWHRNPEGGFGVSFDSPWIRGLLPAIDCTCSGKDENARCTMRLLHAHAKLALEALEVSKLAALGKTREMMGHFTSDSDALALAERIETLIPPSEKRSKFDPVPDIDELTYAFQACVALVPSNLDEQ